MKLGNVVLIALGGLVVYILAKNRKTTMNIAVTPSNEPKTTMNIAVTPPNEPWWRSGKYKQEQILKYVLSQLGKTSDIVSWAPGTPQSVINENYLTMAVNRGILVPSFESEKAFISWLKGQNVQDGILRPLVVNRQPSPAFSENRDLIFSENSNTPLIVNTNTGQSFVDSGLRPESML